MDLYWDVYTMNNHLPPVRIVFDPVVYRHRDGGNGGDDPDVVLVRVRCCVRLVNEQPLGTGFESVITFTDDELLQQLVTDDIVDMVAADDDDVGGGGGLFEIDDDGGGDDNGIFGPKQF
ncbi:hypothetical protein DERF_011401 [Dermatophagoides farinae]|uniref:Uncharacterized protein n=1 Tax=Dermatophagoides farinae TaxID=6954 RepID=A0A922HUU6_DERFA|nr:hypothetical protein DERF_011401 [Dermatophagoides farinae]